MFYNFLEHGTEYPQLCVRKGGCVRTVWLVIAAFNDRIGGPGPVGGFQDEAPIRHVE